MNAAYIRKRGYSGIFLALNWVLIAALALGAIATPAAVRAAAGNEPYSLKVISISAGDSHVLALLNDGTVRAWGKNNIGQLGNGSVQPSNVAMPVYELYNGAYRNLTKIVAVSAGPQYSLALDENGTVFSWGFNASNELGRDPGVMISYAAEPIAGLPKIKKISAGSTHAKALAEDGTVWAWGDNQMGQAGIGTNRNFVPAPVQVLASAGVPLTDIRDIRSKGSQTFALQGDEGKLLAWGYNGRGQLGDGTYTHRTYPIQVTKVDGTPLEQIRAIGSGDEYGLAIGKDGSLWSWGTNETGQLGLNDRTLRTRAEKLIVPSGGSFEEVAMVDGGFSHTLAIKEDGSLWAWGSNMNYLGDVLTGQLGIGDNAAFALTPQKVELAEDGTAISDIEQVAVASFFSVVLRKDGTVWSAGINRDGQLGGNRSDPHLARFAQMTMTDPRQAYWAINKTEVYLNEEATVSLQLADYWKRTARFGTDKIEFQSSIGTVAGLVYEGDGKFSAKVASNAEGNAVISASINGIVIPAKQDVTFVSAETKFKEALDFVIADAEAELAATIEGVDPGQYPARARLAFSSAIAEAKAVSASPNVPYTVYDEARKALLNAMRDYWDSEIIEVDKTALNEVIAAAHLELASTIEGNDPGEYPAAARTALSQAIRDAESVSTDLSAKFAQVEQARSDLDAAVTTYREAKVPEADKAALNAIIADAEAELASTTEGTNPGEYPASARTSLSQAITTAKAVASNAQATAAQVEQARSDLSAAIATYRGAKVPEAGKDALNAVIAEAESELALTTEGTNPGEYPASARTSLSQAITTAKAVASNAQATAAQVEQARSDLSAAIAAYRAAQIPETGKDALNAVIAEAESELASTTEGTNPGEYPAGARTALSHAIATAKAVASNAQATASQVEQARSDLSAALAEYRASEVPMTDAPIWTSGEIRVSEATGRALRLSWPEAKADSGVTGYRIYMYNDPEPLAEIAAGQENSYLVDRLDTGVRYAFTVKAFNDAGESTGLSVEAVTPADKTVVLERIQTAKKRLADTSEGTRPGTYPAGARAQLTMAIAAAEAEAGKDDSLQTAIDAASAALLQAIAAYNDSVIKPMPVHPGSPSAEPERSGNNEIKLLTIRAGSSRLELVPAFSASITDYTVETEAEELEVSFELAHQGAKAVVRQDGKEMNSRLWELQTGENKFIITVVAEDGTERDYRLNIVRKAFETNPPLLEPKDISGHWAENMIKQAIASGLANGYPDQTFRPNQAVTRAEFVVMLVKLLQPKQSGTAHEFADQATIGEWAEQAAIQALALGWVQGYSDGTFRPNQSITRAEAAVIIARALSIGKGGAQSTGFADDSSIPSWAKAAIEDLRLKEIVGGRGSNQYMPHAGMTRAETITLFMRLQSGEDIE